MKIDDLKAIVDYGVIGFLIILSVISIAIILERWFFFRKINYKRYINKKALELDLIKHLGTLATIGSNAPYIGLLGTVLAIIVTFYNLGNSGGKIESALIMKDLALALKATAVGLLVAIPASAFYNILMDKVEVILLQWEIVYGNRE